MRLKIKYKLEKEGANFAKLAHEAKWVEWDENGKASGMHDEPKLGRSLILEPHPVYFTWLTTTVTEIIEQKEGYIKFKTKNSTYTLCQL